MSREFRDLTNDPWTFEYSAESEKRGLYPYHVQPLARTKRVGPGPLGWEVLFTGALDDCTTKLEQADAEYRKRTARGQRS